MSISNQFYANVHCLQGELYVALRSSIAIAALLLQDEESSVNSNKGSVQGQVRGIEAELGSQ
eukprot:scaffold3845_cov109-Skeletonema_marinoi.AAC.8